MITLEYLVSGFMLVGRKAQLSLVMAFMEIHPGKIEGTGCIPDWGKIS